MNRIAGSDADVAIRQVRREYLPILTTIAACLIPLLPVVVSTPIVPPISFLVLISWRLLRPEMWTATTALPLGMFNDLVAGHPLGQSMALWTLVFLAFDVMDARVGWRDYWMDWFAAALAIGVYMFGCWYIGVLMGSKINLVVILPQIALAVLLYPLVARLVLMLDGWRLVR